METIVYDDSNSSSQHKSEPPPPPPPPFSVADPCHTTQLVSPDTQNQPQLTTIGEISVSIGDQEHAVDQHPMEINLASTTPNHPGSTAITMTNTHQDSSIIDGQIANLVEDEHPNTQPTEFHNYREKFHFLYVGLLLVMYPSLTQVVQLKFQNRQSPFEIESYFANTAVVAFITAISISLVLFYMRARLETSINKRFSPIYHIYRILESVFCFFGILAPLALVLVLLHPHLSNGIGYLIISILFVVIFGCNFSDYNKILCNKNVCDLE